MKEATGELNMAVVVAISIAILAAFFFSYLWPLIDNNFQRTSQCNKAVCDCNLLVNNNGIDYCTCWPEGSDRTSESEFYCLYRG